MSATTNLITPIKTPELSGAEFAEWAVGDTSMAFRKDNAQTLSQRGGQATKTRHGRAHYQRRRTRLRRNRGAALAR